MRFDPDRVTRALEFDLERVTRNARDATSEDLLDRVTVYRNGMEPEALEIIEAELRQRGIERAEIEAHAAYRNARMIPLPDGTALPCSFCHRPAVEQRWGMHRMWGLIPVFPRYFAYCEVHLPPSPVTSEDDPHPPE
jgi:hypothetical protein